MPEAGSPDVPFPAAVPEDPDWLPGGHAGVTFAPRSQAKATLFFDGLDMVDPGVLPVLAWWPDGEPARRSPRRLQLRRSRTQVVRP